MTMILVNLPRLNDVHANIMSIHMRYIYIYIYMIIRYMHQKNENIWNNT